MGPKEYVGCCLILQIERNVIQYQNKGWTKDGRQSLVNSYLNGSFHGIFYFIYQTVLKYYKINYKPHKATLLPIKLNPCQDSPEVDCPSNHEL